MATIRDLHQLLHDAVQGNPKAWDWEVGVHLEGIIWPLDLDRKTWMLTGDGSGGVRQLVVFGVAAPSLPQVEEE